MNRLFPFVAFLILSFSATAQPVITSFTPTSGIVGTSVTITGANFNSTTANNTVFFGAVRATVAAGTTTSLTVTAPEGATFQPISVLDNTTTLTGYSPQPYITTFTNPSGTGIPTMYYKPKVDIVTAFRSYATASALGDLDGDGKVDLVTINYGSDRLFAYRNISSPGSIGASSFATELTFSTSFNPIAVAVGDVNGDGKPDIVVTNNIAYSVSVLQNTSTPGTVSFAPKVDFATRVFPNSVAIGDLDGDGKPELVVTNSGVSRISIFQNTSTSGNINTNSFAPKVDFIVGSQPSSVAIGDLDKDGKPDLVVANLSSATVSVLRNTSTRGSITAASFSDNGQFQTGALPGSVAIADVDGDGKLEMLVANYDANFNSISIFRNTSTVGNINAASFASRVDFTTATNPRSISIGDVDGDGKPDLAVANYNSGSVTVLRNTSISGSINTNSFAAKVDFTTAINPRSLSVGDVDGDGIPEILVGYESIDAVSILQVAAPCNNNIWEGTVSTSWTDGANWSCGNVPGPGTKVFIYSNKPRYPVISNNVTCQQLYLDPGVHLEIEKGKIEITGKD